MSFQSIRTTSQWPGKYRHDLLVWRFAEVNTTPRKLAAQSGLSKNCITDALSGDCKKIETLWKIARPLALKWEYLFRFDDFAFRRAVLNGGSRSER